MVLDYSMERHGFFYYLQHGGEVVFEHDGEAYREQYLHVIDDFIVRNVPFETSEEQYGDDRYTVAKIGDPDAYVLGRQEYVIGYSVGVGVDEHDDFDMLYRNLMFCERGETIDSVAFIIEMPADFDEQKVSFSLGAYGSKSADGVSWEKDGNTIRGHLTRPMQSEEVLTVLIFLPDGYYSDGAFDKVIGSRAEEIVSNWPEVAAILMRAVAGLFDLVYG